MATVALSKAALQRLDNLNDWIAYNSQYLPSQVVFEAETMYSYDKWNHNETGYRIVAKAATANERKERLYIHRSDDTITRIKHKWNDNRRQYDKADPKPLVAACEAHWAIIASDEGCQAKREALRVKFAEAKEVERQDARADLDTLGTIIATAVQYNVGTTGIAQSYWRPVALAALKWAVDYKPARLKTLLELLGEGAD